MSNYIEIAYNNNPVVTLEGNIESSIVLNTADTVMSGNIEVKPYVDSSNLNEVSLEIAYKGQTLLTTGGSITRPLVLNTKGRSMNGDITIKQGLPPKKSLEETSWDDISTISQAGIASNYYAVGDVKSVRLNGTVGTLSLDTMLYAYIIGINHRDVNGITFHGFKTSASSGVDVCLIDSKYNSTISDGSKYFNLNHWGSSSSPYNTNYGGWKGCDARYDILGSTNVAPSGYGATPTTSRVGYDAGTATATNPVSNTLMSCLPSDLRAVMQPMTVYTDNKGNKGNTAANVTTSVDYLPLLAEFEIFGARSNANTYEQNNQTQYAYYSAGNSKVKYRHSSTGTAATWWERSPYYLNALPFCTVSVNGNARYSNSRASIGLAPAFMV